MVSSGIDCGQGLFTMAIIQAYFQSSYAAKCLHLILTVPAPRFSLTVDHTDPQSEISFVRSNKSL